MAWGTHEASHGLISLESLSFGGKGIYNVIIHVYTYNRKKDWSRLLVSFH